MICKEHFAFIIYCSVIYDDMIFVTRELDSMTRQFLSMINTTEPYHQGNDKDIHNQLVSSFDNFKTKDDLQLKISDDNIDTKENLKDEFSKEKIREEEEKKSAGFELFFKSNREELQDVPIHFQPSLPTWLSGTLVSHVRLINYIL